MLESVINQAVNKHNDLHGSWFTDKQEEYAKSGLLSTQLLDHTFAIGVNTKVNQLAALPGANFRTARWDGQAISNARLHCWSWRWTPGCSIAAVWTHDQPLLTRHH